MAAVIGANGFYAEYDINSGAPQEVYVGGACVYRNTLQAGLNPEPDNEPLETPGWQLLLAQELLNNAQQMPGRYGHSSLAIWASERGLLRLEEKK